MISLMTLNKTIYRINDTIWADKPELTDEAEQTHNMVITLFRCRHDVAATSKQRYYNVVCLLGYLRGLNTLGRISTILY